MLFDLHYNAAIQYTNFDEQENSTSTFVIAKK
jgi:hypothetical protein